LKLALSINTYFIIHSKLFDQFFTIV